MRPMSRAPLDAPAETAAELPTATEAALLEGELRREVADPAHDVP